MRQISTKSEVGQLFLMDGKEIDRSLGSAAERLVGHWRSKDLGDSYCVHYYFSLIQDGLGRYSSVRHSSGRGVKGSQLFLTSDESLVLEGGHVVHEFVVPELAFMCSIELSLKGSFCRTQFRVHRALFLEPSVRWRDTGLWSATPSAYRLARTAECRISNVQTRSGRLDELTYLRFGHSLFDIGHSSLLGKSEFPCLLRGRVSPSH